MIEHKGTSMVCFNKSKLTKKEIMYIKTPLEGIQIVENEINISVHDPEHKHPKFMSRMVSILYRSVKRK